ncbi:bZIP transcription factor, partial [uncultured Eudoraea sp.]|uniref:bZIP transcription factor n=1 Tax=uncultured Eudoraea sp. TaxID=1035614 RepID=UPI00261757F9
SEAADGDTDDTNEIQDITSPDASVTINQVGNDFELTVAGGVNNLSNSNLIQTGGNRTYDLDGQELYFTGTGFIGIGNSNPQNKLDVSGEIRSQGFSNSNGTVAEPSYAFSNDSDTGMWRGANTNFLRFSTNATEAVTIDPSQQVGIGITAPMERLHVGGTILATGNINGTDITATGDINVTGSVFRAAVDLHPDYVFQKYFLNYSEINERYIFASLREIEAFVKKNHHLPGIKSAKEVQEDGYWNLSESNLQNLEKIEELFLHTINQEKKINQLETKNQAIQEELNTLKAELLAIKNLLKEE